MTDERDQIIEADPLLSVKPSMLSACVTCGHERHQHRMRFTYTGRRERSLESVGPCDMDCGCALYVSTWDAVGAKYGRCYQTGHRLGTLIGAVPTLTCSNDGCGQTWTRCDAMVPLIRQQTAEEIAQAIEARASADPENDGELVATARWGMRRATAIACEVGARPHDTANTEETRP